MKETLAYPNWYNIEKGCAQIGNQLLKENVKVDYILGLTRGGLVPAVIMSHMLEIPMIPVSYSSVIGKGEYKGYANNNLPTITAPIASGTGMIDYPSLLIVDDICDSGHTMNEVVNHYMGGGHSVHSAVLYFKEGSVHRPDYKWMYLDAKSPWIIFPWEL